jgi:small-conductance mechanosensitive channel
MSEVQSLEELKSQNAAEEAAKSQQTEAEEIDAEHSEDLDVDPPEQTEGDDTEEPEEDWLKEDGADEEKKQSDLVPAAVIAQTRRKLRGQISEKDVEIQRLKSELDQIKANPAATSAQDLELEVAVESWEYEGDPATYGRYKAELDARNARKIMQAESARAQQAQQIEQQQREIAEQFNQHYDRVEALVASGKITVEKYKAAEANVVEKLDQMTGAGEAVMKKFVASIGAGSEKVITHLGTNGAAQQRLEQELKRDPSGIAAAIYLGGLREKFNSAPVNKPKTAPTPDVPLTGKAPVTSSHYKAYEKAVAKDDPTAMLEAKRAARAAGIDTSKW